MQPHSEQGRERNPHERIVNFGTVFFPLCNGCAATTGLSKSFLVSVRTLFFMETQRIVAWVGLVLIGLTPIALAEQISGWKFVDGQWDSGRVQPRPADGLVLAEEGKGALPIVISDQARPPEITAAAQLSRYLEKISGADFPVFRESEHPAGKPAIFIGATQALAEIKMRPEPGLVAEDWRIRFQGESLFLYGGYPRGALYAVFQLLEDDLGVHWWTQDSETVPRRSTVTIPRLDRSGRPVFEFRAITYYSAAERQSRDKFDGNRMVAAVRYDGGLFAAQNRLNNQVNKDYHIDLRFGGQQGFGLPGFVHTYFDYVDPEKHFATHPEWFSLVNGERRHVGAQLDVMNPELRAFMLRALLGFIETTVKEDALAGYSSRLVFDISPQDHEGYDEGKASRNLVEKEGTEMAPLLDMVNELADAIKEPYPTVRLETLAYKATQEPPKTLRAADNVIITVADTASNPARALSTEGNGAFLDLLKRWKARAKHLRIWDYATAYGIFSGGLPLPVARTQYQDLKTYHELGVEGVLVQIDDPWMGADRDFLYWVTMKGMDNPGRDFSSLEKTFTDGFFGPAGSSIRKYYALLEEAAASKKADDLVTFKGHQPGFAFLDLPFLTRASELFDSAEAAVQNATEDPEALLRVRKARLGVDEAILRGYQRGLLDQWKAQKGTEANFPLEIRKVKDRYRETLRQVIRSSVLPDHLAAWDAFIDDKILLLTPHERRSMDFPGAKGAEVFDFLPDQMGWNSGLAPVQEALIDTESGTRMTVRPVEDSAADAGIALELVTKSVPTSSDTPDWRPLWSYFGLSENRVVKSPMPMDAITNDYRWIKLGEFPPVERGLASLFATASSLVGVIWMNSDYYPEIFTGEATTVCEFWIKVRRVNQDDRAPAYRVARAAIFKK